MNIFRKIKASAACSVLLMLLCVVPAGLRAQSEWTPAPSGRLLNDYSGMLSEKEAQLLEHRLVGFSDTTSNQITVLIVPSLHGDEIKAVAYRVGETWGVGQEKLSNGVVILIKSKTEQEPDGQVAIMPGYGLEGALPDAFCAHIIDDYMVRYLAEGDYYEAICEALDVIEPVCRGEYSYAQYKEDEASEMLVGFVVLIVLIVAVVIVGTIANKKGRKGGGGKGNGGGNGSDSDWLLAALALSRLSNGAGRSRGFGGSGDFGSGGFSSGGFGGFGGGHFGGGGASGRF